MKKYSHLTERTNKSLHDRFISMSNALARSAQGLTLSEKRVVALALVKTDSVPEQDAINAMQNNGWNVKLTAEEYSIIYNLDTRTAYDQIKMAADKLLCRQVKTMQQTPKGAKEIKTNWCGQCTYHHGEGWVEIAFTPQISPHLLGLREKFTSYQLKQASALRSIYSWRLFECLQSWKSKGVWSPTIEEFSFAMEAPESCRKNFGQMRLRIIDPALKELQEKDHKHIELELKKSGRKVTGLVFKMVNLPHVSQ